MRRTITRITVGILLCGAFAASPGCGKKPDAIKIGVIAPFTGGEAAIAKQHLNGIVLAVEELNRADANVTYQIITSNDQGNAATARAAFTSQLVEQKIRVAFVATRGGAMAIAPDADREFVPMFANCSHPLMTIMHYYAFRNYPSSALEIRRMVAFASQSLGIGSLALLCSDDEYGRDAHQAIRQECSESGIQISASQPYGGATDPRRTVTTILAEKPPAIYVFGSGTATVDVLSALRASGYRGIILGSRDFSVAPIAELAKDALEGVYYPVTAFELLGNAEFADKYRQRFNTEGAFNSAIEYDAVRILAKAVEIGSAQKISLTNALKKVGDYSGVVGEYRYVDREWLPPMRIVRVKGGRATPL